MKTKIKWKASDVPVGKFRSFSQRAWPTAFYTDDNETAAAHFSCVDAYSPKMVKLQTHGPLTIYVADHSGEKWTWRKLNKTAPSLKEAKEIVEQFLNTHPEITFKFN